MTIRVKDAELYNKHVVIVPLDNFDNSELCYDCYLDGHEKLASVFLKEPIEGGYQYTPLCGEHGEVKDVEAVFQFNNPNSDTQFVVWKKS